MFKLESYITPWLLSYIDQYVKLRREDFQLSLWGGDVVFNNLELRLGNIQKLVPTLPIIFQSGLIHELRIHIPWIRINSEPIVVTLNQIELVIVLNKERLPTSDASVPFQSDIPSDSVLLQQQQPTTAEQSNYVQTVLSRILNNVQIIVNNLIVKFVEDDVVISLSSRTAQCFAVNGDWLKSFVELTAPDLSLRRLISLPDLTLCLDRRDPNGKVHRYEVPLLSRCSFECRIQMFYANVYQQLNTKPIQTRLSFNCANIEVSIADKQLSMIRRLTESIMLLVNEPIPPVPQDPLPKTEQNGTKNPPLPPPLPPLPPLPPPLPPSSSESAAETSVQNTAEDAQPGWISWAWSYVPSVTTMFVEDENPPEEATPIVEELQTSEQNPSIVNQDNNNSNSSNTNQGPTPILLAGIDLDRISLQYKITKSNGEKTSSVPFIGLIIEKANIMVERYKLVSTTDVDGQSVVSSVRKVKVSTSKISLTWDERLCLAFSDVHFTLHYDRHVRMTRLSLMINDLNLCCDHHLLIYPCQATLKLDHLRTYSLLHLDLSSLTIQLDFPLVAYLITVINQIRSIVDITTSIFHPSTLIETVEDDRIFVDDLRNASMKCLFQPTHEHPNANEIVFSTINQQNLTSAMTWKYLERRSILKCHISPLPFDDDLAGVVLSSHRVKTVECLMQYWHFGTKQFVTWQTFELSDGQPLFLDFSNDLGKNPYSEMWRIVLINASSIINQANSLAASTRIDSLESQRYEPSIEMAMTIPNIRLNFLLDPPMSKSRFQSVLSGCKHDVFTLSLDNISFDFSQRFETKLLGLETSLALDVLEYRFLTKRSAIEPSLINLDVLIDSSQSNIHSSSSEIFPFHNEKLNQFFRSAKTSLVVQCNFHIDHLNIRLSQSLCHVINILHHQFLRSDLIKVLELKIPISSLNIDQSLYYTYYLFTNHLNIPIGLKQNNTTDNFTFLSSNETMDFVWSKLNTDQISIQFSLANLSNDPFYSSSIDIHQPIVDQQRRQIVQFDNSPHVFYLQIDYDQHQIRRHLHLIGRILIKNLSHVDLNLKLFLNVGSRSIDLILNKDQQSYLSCLQTIEDIQYIQWNSSMKYSVDQLNADGIISTSDGISLWIHLFQSEQFHCFIFTPIVIYRSFLPQLVQLHLNDEHSFPVQSKGFYTFFDQLQLSKKEQKYSHRLQQIDADQLTESVFQLHSQSHLTVPLASNVSLESNLIDSLLTCEIPTSPNPDEQLIDLLRDEQVKSAQTEEDFPPTFNEDLPNAPLISSVQTEFTTNSIDCRIEPVRLYPHLNTILIQLKPLTLIENRTPFDFHFSANLSHDHVYLSANQLTCLAKLIHSQMQFVLIDPHDGEHIQCQTIDLILRPIAMMNGNALISHRLFYKKYLDLYFIKSSNNDFFLFRLQHDYLDQTHIFTLQSKFLFNNQTNLSLQVSVLPIAQQQYLIDYPYHCFQSSAGHSQSIYRFQGVPSSDIQYYFLFQRVVQERNSLNLMSKPVKLFSNLDEHGNRQCFCLYQRDSLLKIDPNKSKLTLFDSLSQSFRAELFSVNQTIRSTSNQIEISIQSNPSWAFLQLINTCSCSLLCRLENISSYVHIIPPFSSTFIGIDSPDISSVNQQQYLENFMNGSRFYLAQYSSPESKDSSLIQAMSHYFQQITSKAIQWSRPMRVDSQLEDVFLPIPGLHDVLIRSQSVSFAASRTLIIEPVHRQRPTKTMVTSKTGQTVPLNSSSIPHSSSFPSANVISETTSRHYRSNYMEKSSFSNATNQYLKAWQQQYSQFNHRQIQLNFSIEKISVSLMDELTNISMFPEILRLTMDKCQVFFHQRLLDSEPLLIQKQFFCSIHQFQIDNQCYNPKNNFDFPVLLMSKDEKRVSKPKITVNDTRPQNDSVASPLTTSNHHRENSSSSIDTIMTEDPMPAFDSLSHNHRTSRSIHIQADQKNCLTIHFHQINERFIQIHFQLQPFDVYLEDQFIYLLLKIFSELLPLDLTIDRIRRTRVEPVENRLMKVPFVCDSLYIGPIDIVVSVHASMKVYIGCHQLPMFADRFQKTCIYSTNKQLLTLITRHYFMSLLTRSPLLLGSFDLLGNPSSLIRNITDGVYDLFHLPYVGMRQGPSGFMFGISEGATSLLKHLSLGTLTSLTTFANSVAKNMDRLAMDSEHSHRTEETCRQIPIGMTNGLLQGLELFSLSLLGAIAGLAEQPIQSFRNRVDSQAATTTVLSGVGKGLVGIVAKPVSGVAQLISQTGQGILYGTGLMNIPHRRHRRLEQDARINTTHSYLKLTRSCQLIEDDDEIVDSLDYVVETHPIEHGIIVLTRKGHLIIYHKDDENAHGNYLLNHVELNASPESTALLLFNNLSFYVDSRLRHQFLALCRFIRQ